MINEAKENLLVEKIAKKTLGRTPTAADREDFHKIYKVGKNNRNIYAFYYKENFLGTVLQHTDKGEKVEFHKK